VAVGRAEQAGHQGTQALVGEAGLAVIGALVFVLVWEWCAIRRTLATHSHQAQPPESFWRDRAALHIPERRP
jgi:hypothetical protein